MMLSRCLLLLTLTAIATPPTYGLPPAMELPRRAPAVRLKLPAFGKRSASAHAGTAKPQPAAVAQPAAAAAAPAQPAATASPAATPAAAKPVPEWLSALTALPDRFYFWPSSKAPGAWRFSAGYVWRNFGDARFSSRSRGIASGIPFVVPSAVAPADDPKTGKGTGFQKRDYDDGFVYPDAATSVTGDTPDWGYTSGTQLSGTWLSFHGDGPAWTTVSQRLSQRQDLDWGGQVSGGGPILSLSYEKPWSDKLSLGLDISASHIATDVAQAQSSFTSVTAVRSYSSRVTDSYDTGGTLLPPAPYTGSPAGGALLFATPTRRQDNKLDSLEKTYLFDRIEERLDLRFTTASLGLSGSYAQGRLRGSFGYGLALNVAAWSADKTDTLYSGTSRSDARAIAQWRSHSSDTVVLPGFYLQAALSYELTQTWAMGFFGRHDWSRDLSGSVGDTRFTLDMDGWSAGAQATYRF